MDKAAKPTIFDVARLSGVSIKTVSRVVNKEPNVRPRTRQKVAQAVARLSYQPSAAARGLSGRRSRALGLVYENPKEFSYVGEALASALAACEGADYSLLLKPITLPSASLAEDVRKFALQARLDGMLLLAPVCDQPAAIQALAALQVPLAAISPRQPVPGSVNIFCQEEEASYRLATHVIEQGHRRLGFIKGHPDHGGSQQRYQGYKAALKAQGLPLNRSLVRQGQFDFESGRHATASLLALPEPPSVIIAGNDDMAAGAYYEASERGLAIPADLSIAGFDDTKIATHIWPPLTTVRQPIRQMSAQAVQSLIALLNGEVQPQEPLPCEVVIRQSTALPKVK